MKKFIVLAAILFGANVATIAQQQKSTEKSKPASSNEQAPVKAKPNGDSKLKPSVASPEKVQTRLKPSTEKAPVAKPDPRLRVKRSKPNHPKQAVKSPTESK